MSSTATGSPLGTRSESCRRLWLDPRDGRLRDAPYYDGLQVDFTASAGSESYFELGSSNGSGNGDAGYEFCDELDTGLVHAPYVVTMAAPGPNGNGSRFRVFGQAASSARNGKHTIFGRVQEGSGRSVVDAIIAAGAGNTTIQSIDFPDRSGHAHDLAVSLKAMPVLEPVSAPLQVILGQSTSLMFTPPQFSVFSVHDSGDLCEWQHLARRYSDDVVSVPSSGVVLDSAEQLRRFYHCSLARYPLAPHPPAGSSSFAGRTLTISGPGVGTLIYFFNPEGNGGHYENVVTPGEAAFFSGPFTVDESYPPHFGPYSSRVLVNTPGLGGAVFQWIRTGWDGSSPSGSHGRHVTLLLNASLDPVFEDAGGAELSTP